MVQPFWWRRPLPDPVAIYNWRRFDERLTTSGQPTEAQLAELLPLGVRHVINLGLHTHEKALPDEAATVAGLGMTYIHIPVEFDRPTDEDFARFSAAMAQIGNDPVHVHCIANFRVTAFLYRWDRDVCHTESSRAAELMHSVWQPGGVWAAFIGDEGSIPHEHRPPK